MGADGSGGRGGARGGTGMGGGAVGDSSGGWWMRGKRDGITVRRMLVGSGGGSEGKGEGRRENVPA